MKVTLVSSDLPLASGNAGGVATFVRHFSRVLSEAGEQVSVLWTANGRDRSLDPEWLESCRALGIAVEDGPEPEERKVFPRFRPMRVSEAVAARVRDADVVYLSDWSNMGFHALRSRRFTAAAGPTFVTVLHGASAWVAESEQRYPRFRDLNLAFMEEYSAHHSDFVFSPSRYMLDWVGRAGWSLPPSERVDVLGLPHPGDPERARPRPADAYRRIVFFGRLERRKGIELFVDALALLARRNPERLRSLDQIVLLGAETLHGRPLRSRFAGATEAVEALHQAGLPATAVTGLDSGSAQRYLAERTADSLVLVPSPADNFPYTVIEGSLIPGLNMLCSNGGGIPEILGPAGVHQLFRPEPASIAATVARWLERGPAVHDRFARYDWRAANQRWASAHDRVCDHARSRAPRSGRVLSGTGDKRVDVCISHFNHGRYLPHALLSFERQTRLDYHLIVTDDGSDDPDSLAVFERMRERYGDRGWDFHSLPNENLGAARNTAARRGRAEYLCFFDSEDVASPRLVERLLEAMALSGDDALGCGYREFEGDAFPFDLETGEAASPALCFNHPIGNSLIAALANPGVLPSSVFIVRRSVLDRVGGWSEARATGHIEFELHVRLALRGFRTDVIPEALFFRRHVPDSRRQTLDRFRARRLVLDTYQGHLDGLGLHGLAAAFQGLHEQVQAQGEGVTGGPPAAAPRWGASLGQLLRVARSWSERRRGLGPEDKP